MFSHVLVASINFPFRRLRKSMGYWPSGYWASLLTDQCQIQLLYPQTRFRGSYWLPMIFGRDRQVKIFWLPLNAFTQVLDIAWGHLSGELIENRSENLEHIDDVVVLIEHMWYHLYVILVVAREAKILDQGYNTPYVHLRRSIFGDSISEWLYCQAPSSLAWRWYSSFPPGWVFFLLRDRDLPPRISKRGVKVHINKLNFLRLPGPGIQAGVGRDDGDLKPNLMVPSVVSN